MERRVARTIALMAVVGALLASSIGCRAFRAQVGVGFGFGVDAEMLGLAHASFEIGAYGEIGPCYGLPPDQPFSPTNPDPGLYGAGVYAHTYLGLFAIHDRESVTTAARRHTCFLLFPGLTSYLFGLDGHPANSWAMEIGIALIFVDLRLGFNPVALFTEPAPPRQQQPPPSPPAQEQPPPAGEQPAAPAPNGPQPAGTQAPSSGTSGGAH